MSKRIFDITESIINRGDRQDSSKCPIAIALMQIRELTGEWNVFSHVLLQYNDEHTEFFKTSIKLRDIIKRYDIGSGMQPFSMVVDSDECRAYLEGETV